MWSIHGSLLVPLQLYLLFRFLHFQEADIGCAQHLHWIYGLAIILLTHLDKSLMNVVSSQDARHRFRWTEAQYSFHLLLL